MVLNYILCITSVYPHKTLLLVYTDISCPYPISAFESLSNAALSDNHESWFFTSLSEDIILCHTAQKKMNKNIRHPYTISISVSRVFPSFLNQFTGYDLETTTASQTNKKWPTIQPKTSNKKAPDKPGWTCLLCFNSRLRHPKLGIHSRC